MKIRMKTSVSAITVICACVCILLSVSSAAWAITFSKTITNATSFTVSSSPLGGVSGCNMSTGSHYYTSQRFTSIAADATTFRTTSATLSSGDDDTFIAVYASSFDPANPESNLVGCDDDYGAGFLSQFVSTIAATGTPYDLVITAYSSAGLTGTVSGDITPDVFFVPVPVYGSVPSRNSTINAGTVAIGSPVSTTMAISEEGDLQLDVTGVSITGTNAGISA